jgi:hypothetical protein
MKKRSLAHPHILTIRELFIYNLIFFVPLGVSFWISLLIAKSGSSFLEASPLHGTFFFANIFAMFIFAVIIPLLHKHENIAGVRYSILAFAVVALGLTLPSAFKGNLLFLLNLPTFYATYLLVTFIAAPEVLGIERNLRKWFVHRKQFLIIIVYIAIAVLYMVGFGNQYHQLYQDSPSAFAFDNDVHPGFGTFVYFSVITFATIGYGDITPVSALARMTASFEALLGMIVNVIFIAILIMFISGAASQRQAKEVRLLKKEETFLKRLLGHEGRKRKRRRK